MGGIGETIGNHKTDTNYTSVFEVDTSSTTQQLDAAIPALEEQGTRVMQRHIWWWWLQLRLTFTATFTLKIQLPFEKTVTSGENEWWMSNKRGLQNISCFFVVWDILKIVVHPYCFPPVDDLLDVSSDDLNMKIHLKIVHVWVISFRHYLI